MCRNFIYGDTSRTARWCCIVVDIGARGVRECTSEEGSVANPGLLAEWGGVPPHIVGQVYRAMRLAGELTPLGWVESDDVKGGNNGKPARTYRLTETP